MNFEHNRSVEKFGERIGYAFSYFLFTSILFLISNFLNKFPESWTYFHVMLITIIIAIIGALINRFLK
jgi:hypothetical protein